MSFTVLQPIKTQIIPVEMDLHSALKQELNRTDPNDLLVLLTSSRRSN